MSTQKERRAAFLAKRALLAEERKKAQAVVNGFSGQFGRVVPVDPKQ